jgi:UDP-N-acetylglucosamine 2-epimerase
MLDQVLSFFNIKPDYDLSLMKPNQNLYNLTGEVISRLKPILEDFKYDFVYVHGTQQQQQRWQRVLLVFIQGEKYVMLKLV